MHIKEEILDGEIAVLKIEGEFWENEWALHEAIKRLVEQKKTNVVVDFTHSSRINSQGIGVLVACVTSVTDAEGALKIAGANKRILEVLNLLNLYTVIESYPTAEEAVASFS